MTDSGADDAKEQPTKRRDALGLGVAVGLLPLAAVERVTGAAQRGSVDTALVRAHAGLADTLVTVYHQVRPDVAASIVGRHADLVLELLGRPMVPSDRRQLEAIAVGAHAQAGTSAFHAGDLATARRYLVTGCDVAEESGDAALEAQALGAAAERAHGTPRSGRLPDRVLQLLERARDKAQRADVHTRAWVEISYGEARAATGDIAGCHSAIRIADELLGGEVPDARSPFFSPAGKFYGLAGHLRSAQGVAAMVDGNTDDAEETFNSIVERPAGPRQRVINLAHLGAAHATAGEPEAACAALRAALGDCQATAYAMGVERVRGVRVRFPAEWASLPCVTEFDEGLRSAA